MISVMANSIVCRLHLRHTSRPSGVRGGSAVESGLLYPCQALLKWRLAQVGTSGKRFWKVWNGIQVFFFFLLLFFFSHPFKVVCLLVAFLDGWDGVTTP